MSRRHVRGPTAPTIRDVAMLAQVSVATVSAVINGSRPVSDGPRERVLAAISELRYRPNLVARALYTRRTQTLALLVPSLSNPLFVGLAEAVESAAHAAGYAMVVASSHGLPERATDQLTRLVSLGVDGVLAVLSWDIVQGLAVTKADLDRRPLPVIGVAGSHQVAGIDAFCVDDEEAGVLAGRHLQALGHRCVAFIGAADSTATRLRYAGLVAALGGGAGTGGSEGAHLFETPGHSETDGAGAAQRLLAGRTPFTALAVLNDAMAVGALGVLRSHGVEVPGEMSVMGFGNTVSAFSHPKLTTIAYPTGEMGRLGVARMLESVTGAALVPEVHRLHASLVIRGSTAPAADGGAPRPARAILR